MGAWLFIWADLEGIDLESVGTVPAVTFARVGPAGLEDK